MTDTVGGEQTNMRLSRDRAIGVGQAMLTTGKVTAAQNVADAGGRVVDIGVH